MSMYRMDMADFYITDMFSRLFFDNRKKPAVGIRLHRLYILPDLLQRMRLKPAFRILHHDRIIHPGPISFIRIRQFNRSQQ